MRIADPALSRQHAEFLADGSTVVVRDLCSRNGIYINGHRVQQAVLRDQDVVRAGDTLLIAAIESGVPADADATSCAVGKLPLILHGETGTGKEVLARRIHELSGRTGRFVAVDCTNLPQNLAEAELFGYGRGAFSGALGAREGLILHAHRGTVLLDEIRDLSFELQGKLLRVLENHAIRALGTNNEIPVDIRVIAASPVDLPSIVSAGHFRRDLYARLAGRTIRLLPLRQRKQCILSLLQDLASELDMKLRLTPSSAELLLMHDWPENVRELKMFARRAKEDMDQKRGMSTLSSADVKSLGIGRIESAQPSRAKESETSPRRPRIDCEALQRALADADGNVSRAARLLGRRRELVHRWIRKYGLRPNGC